MLDELYIPSLMKSDLNLRLSCRQLPGSARLARGWCALKLTGLFCLCCCLSTCGRGFQVLRTGSSQPWRSMLSEYRSPPALAFFLPSFQNNPLVFICPPRLAFASSPQLLSRFTWRRESRCGIQPRLVFLCSSFRHICRGPKRRMWKVLPLLFTSASFIGNAHSGAL